MPLYEPVSTKCGRANNLGLAGPPAVGNAFDKLIRSANTCLRENRLNGGEQSSRRCASDEVRRVMSCRAYQTGIAATTTSDRRLNAPGNIAAGCRDRGEGARHIQKIGKVCTVDGVPDRHDPTPGLWFMD